MFIFLFKTMEAVLSQENSTTQNKGKIHVKARVNSIEHYHIDILTVVMVFNATFNNISVISWRTVEKNRITRRKPPTCRKSLTNFII